MADTSSLLPPISPNPNPNPNPTLRPIRSAAFKREERQKRKERKKRDRLFESLSLWDPLSSIQSRPSDTNPTVSDTPWPCDPNPPENPRPVEWTWDPIVPPKSAPLLHDGASSSSSNVQMNAVKKCKEFFDKEEEQDCLDDESVVKFFSDLFENGVALKRVYEEKKEKGDLVCLVCEKKFVGVNGLVQHANTITKTKRKAVHRVYGSTVNRVLGLEINQTQVVDYKEENASDSEEDLMETCGLL